jgi:hypothetical protein
MVPWRKLKKVRRAETSLIHHPFKLLLERTRGLSCLPTERITPLIALLRQSTCIQKSFERSIRLAFLAPKIIEAIFSGDHSKSFLSITRLHDAHSLSWIEQTRQFKNVRLTFIMEQSNSYFR